MLKNERLMSVHLHNALGKLKDDILELASMAEAQLQKAVAALVQRNPRTAREVIDHDTVIDRKELDIEEECLQVLALHQPVAHDLRFVISALKMTNDLERIGDYAVHIAERTIVLSERSDIQPLVDFSSMTALVAEMLRKAINSLINQDAELAREVWKGDDAIDDLHKEVFTLFETRVKQKADEVHHLLQFVSVSRYLERVADLATNIADDVVYMVEGHPVRHSQL
jgi:phosphate transport system protein